MPAKINSLNKTEWKQKKLLDFFKTDVSKFFQENILKITSSKKPFFGFCYGASAAYLYHSDKDSEQDFISTYNKYLDNCVANNAMMQKKRGDLAMTSVADYKNYIEKKHQVKQGNKLLKEIFDIQKLRCSSAYNYNLSLHIPLSSATLEEKNFLKLIDLALNENIERCKGKDDRMLKITMASLMPDNSQCAKEIYSLNSSEISRADTEIQKEASDIIEPAINKKTNQTKINNLLDLMLIFTNEKIEKSWLDKNKQQNLTTSIKMQDEYEKMTKLNDFMDIIRACEDESQNYIFLSQNHACAINIKKNNESETYQFFDPNEGIYQFHNVDEFTCFLKKFMDEHETYKFIKDSDSNYQISFVKLNRIDPSLNNHGNKKIFDGNLKTNKLLALDNFEVVFKRKSFKNLIPKNKTYRIVHRHFDKENHLVTLAFNYTKSNNHKQKTIYSPNIETPILHQVIQSNLALLKKTDEDIFIDNKGNIYPVAPNISMEDFNLNTDPNVMFGSKTLNNQV